MPQRRRQTRHTRWAKSPHRVAKTWAWLCRADTAAMPVLNSPIVSRGESRISNAGKLPYSTPMTGLAGLPCRASPIWPSGGASDVMRKATKILHTLASCGLIGAIMGYMVVLVAAPQDTAAAYANARAVIAALCNYMLLPSLAIAMMSGLFSMVVHPPFRELRWAWLKALLGFSMFEATLGIIQAKSTTAAALSARIAAGEAEQKALADAIANEWGSLIAIMTLSIANVVVGVWRPRLWKKD